MMYIFNHNIRIVTLMGILFAGLLFAACEDNPASSDNFGEHAAAVGFELRLDNELLVRYFQREYEFDPDNNFPELIKDNSSLLFTSDFFNRATTDQFHIRWIDQNEVVFDLAQFGEASGGTAGMAGEFNLLFEYLIPETRDTQPEEDRAYTAIYNKEVQTWRFALDMLQEGRTDLRINLFHIDHSDLVPVPLPVYIEL